jgi:glucose-6-phosphate isomerase
MAFKHAIDLALGRQIGGAGMPETAIEAAMTLAGTGMERLRQEAASGALPLLRVPAETSDLAAIRAAAERIRGGGTTDVVFLGTGGSSLGGQTLAQLTGYGTAGLSAFLPEPRVHFIDNLDPLTFAALLKTLPLKTTKFVSISKSGGTGETLLQTIAAITALRAAGISEDKIGWHFQGLSEPAKPGKLHALRALLEPFGVPFLDHHTGIGGRYSVLTNCRPAACGGDGARHRRDSRQGAAKDAGPDPRRRPVERASPPPRARRSPSRRRWRASRSA